MDRYQLEPFRFAGCPVPRFAGCFALLAEVNVTNRLAPAAAPSLRSRAKPAPELSALIMKVQIPGLLGIDEKFATWMPPRETPRRSEDSSNTVPTPPFQNADEVTRCPAAAAWPKFRHIPSSLDAEIPPPPPPASFIFFNVSRMAP